MGCWWPLLPNQPRRGERSERLSHGWALQLPEASWELLAKNAPGHPAAFVDPRVSECLLSVLRGQAREARIDAGELGLSSALSRVWSILAVDVESCFFEQISA